MDIRLYHCFYSFSIASIIGSTSPAQLLVSTSKHSLLLISLNLIFQKSHLSWLNSISPCHKTALSPYQEQISTRLKYLGPTTYLLWYIDRSWDLLSSAMQLRRELRFLIEASVPETIPPRFIFYHICSGTQASKESNSRLASQCLLPKALLVPGTFVDLCSQASCSNARLTVSDP